jgi:hypothetical protein
MRFAVILALAASAFAATIPTERALGQCACPPDKTGAKGTLIKQSNTSYQCAYADGACSYDTVRSRQSLLGFELLNRLFQAGVLANPGQSNCQTLAPCILV